MTNEQMKAGRFLKLAKGRKLFSRMNACWNVGGIVTIGTATRATHVKPNARELVWLGKSGSLYIRRGKANDCLDFCAFRFTA